jgi:hypothetical protein
MSSTPGTALLIEHSAGKASFSVAENQAAL